MEKSNPDSVVKEATSHRGHAPLKSHADLVTEFRAQIAAFFLFDSKKQATVLNLLQREVASSCSTATLRDLVQSMGGAIGGWTGCSRCGVSIREVRFGCQEEDCNAPLCVSCFDSSGEARCLDHEVA